jgi:biotin carboxylase
MSTRAAVGIVDGISSGVLLAPEFKRRGHPCVHIQSQPVLPALLAPFDRDAYVDNVVHRGNLDETLLRLRQFEPACVIPGAEHGVQLADALSEALGLRTNGTGLSAARRDKFEMIEAMRRQGIPTVQCIKASHLDQALAWIHAHTELPVVVKPPKSSGTNGVHFCGNTADVERAFDAIIGHRDAMDIMNDEVIVQSFLRGTEYIVDTVSCDRKHCVVAFWQYGKHQRLNGASFVYDHAVLLPHAGELQDLVYPYVFRVLDALGIQNGPSHSEVIVTNRGPILVEVGARLCGALAPVLCRAATGSSQVEVTADAYLDQAAFAWHLDHPYVLNREALRVLLIAKGEGILESLPLLEDVRKLDSFFDMRIFVKPGDRLRLTTDFLTHPGLVDLVHERRDTVEADLRRVRALEDSGFYRLRS